MNRTCLPGSRSTLRTIFARRSLPDALASIDARGTLTIENSAATNIALTTRSVTMTRSGISTSGPLAVVVIFLVKARRGDDHRSDLAVLDTLNLHGELPDVQAIARFRHTSGRTHHPFADGDVLARPRTLDPDARPFEGQVTGKPDAAVAQAERQQPRRLELVGDAAKQ